MEIRVLRYFLTVVREESITRAAEVLHITQPTLSRQIAQMEEEMGVRLFDRGSRKIALTSEGMLLRRRAEEILELVDKTEKELTEQDEMVEGTVSIGFGDLAAVRMLPEIFRSFHERYPGVTFDLYTAIADHVKDRMDRGLTDIGLLMEPGEHRKVRVYPPQTAGAVAGCHAPGFAAGSEGAHYAKRFKGPAAYPAAPAKCPQRAGRLVRRGF